MLVLFFSFDSNFVLDKTEARFSQAKQLINFPRHKPECDMRELR